MSASLFGASSVLEYTLKSIDGNAAPLAAYKGKVVLLVNVASKCGYTPQYEGLEAMYRKYKDRGLMVVGFPTNDFRQELATNKEIGEFCRLTYDVQFPMIEKRAVTGEAADALYKQLRAATGQSPKWNFHKYLIAPGAKQVYSFATRVEPDAPEIMSKLLPLLK